MIARPNQLLEYWRLSLARSREGELSLVRQLLEMSALSLAHGLGPGYYHLAGLWRRKIPWRDKWAHLGGRAYTHRIAELNPKHYQKLSQNKFAEKAILEHLKVPCMPFAGYACGGHGRCRDGTPLSSGADFVRLLTKLNWPRICLKPIEGFSGKGFTPLEITWRDAKPCVQKLDDDMPLPADDYWETKVRPRLDRGVLLEAFLEQHEDYARFNPTSVNTLRLWVRQNRSGRAKVVLGYLRVGRAGSLVDNQSAGGIVVPVDLETGRLSAGQCGTWRREVFQAHPDHGAAFMGETLSHLTSAQELACECLELFPGLTFAGADVALSVDGPIMLELNAAPDRQGSAFVDIPSSRLLL